MSERKVNLRVSAIGGDRLKAELRSVGKEGQHALSLLETGGPGASRGLHATGLAADELMARLSNLSMKAAQAANSFRQVEGAGTSVLNRVNAATGVSAVPSRSAEDIAAYGRALDETRAKYNPMFAAIQRYRSELADLRAAHKSGAVSADEYSAALSRLRQQSLQEIGVIKGRVQGYQAAEKGAGMARFQLVQLGYQLNDIGVSLAGGQNPLIVMIQQGAQIAQIYGNGQGGVQAMLRQTGGLIGGLVTKFWPLIAVIGAGSAMVAGMTREINALGGETVTFGDTALAVFQVIGGAIWEKIKPAVDVISDWFWDAWDKVAAGSKWVTNILVNSFRVFVAFIGDIPGIVAAEFTRISNVAKEAYHAVTVIWGALPAAIGDFAFGAANALIGGVEAMLNGVVTRINNFIDGLNSALSMLPEWAVGEGGISIGRLGDVSLGRVANPYQGGVDNAQHQFSAAQARILEAAKGGNDAWNEFREGASDIWGSDPMGAFFDAVTAQARVNARNRKDKDKKDGGGGGAKDKKKEDEELGFLDKIMKSLNDYVKEASDFGQQIGDALVGAFKSAEDALVDFVKTGKLSISDLVSSIIADFARVAIRGFIMAPLAQGLGNILGGPAGSMLTSAFVQHSGGAAGSGPVRQVSAANFVNAPRLHNGMGGLRADEYAAILQRGERVLNRQETRAYENGGGGPVVVNFNGVRDAASFRQSRTQIASDLSRAVGMARRGI